MINRFKVEDFSMEPDFMPGDHIIVISYIFRKPKLDDIIVFKHPKKEKYLLKRIDKIENQEYIVKGNDVHSEDSRKFGPISKDLIVGKVWIKA